jgi:coproporphyrinogen III oxidase-like Fe-S oxidoreductase
MLSAIKRELAFYLKHPNFGLEKRKVHSIYFGGGTPTLAPVIEEIALQANENTFLKQSTS